MQKLWRGEPLHIIVMGSSIDRGSANPRMALYDGPYGTRQRVLKPGESIEIDIPGTDFSLAYVDDPKTGTLIATVDGEERLRVSTNQSFKTADNQELFLENRRGIRNLPYGMHLVHVTADQGAVRLLGIYSYDNRANRKHENVLRGYAVPGEQIQFSAEFHARPIVLVSGGLKFRSTDLYRDRLTFTGTSAGGFEVVGQ
ncbi:MAG: hypothetical protein JWM11_7794 [Planctomycetaceae bacterium]|nr:hypothetical protein [Planctomycetaceae bacterium]